MHGKTQHDGHPLDASNLWSSKDQSVLANVNIPRDNVVCCAIVDFDNKLSKLKSTCFSSKILGEESTAKI